MPDALDCAEFLDYNDRLVAGDPLARDSFLCRFHPYLFEQTKLKFPDHDADRVHDGALNALLDYCKHPSTFDQRGAAALKAFLLKAAWCNADNLIASERRLKERERKVAQENPEKTVAFDPSARVISIEEQNQHAADVDKILSLLKDRDR